MATGDLSFVDEPSSLSLSAPFVTLSLKALLEAPFSSTCSLRNGTRAWTVHHNREKST